MTFPLKYAVSQHADGSNPSSGHGNISAVKIRQADLGSEGLQFLLKNSLKYAKIIRLILAMPQPKTFTKEQQKEILGKVLRKTNRYFEEAVQKDEGLDADASLKAQVQELVKKADVNHNQRIDDGEEKLNRDTAAYAKSLRAILDGTGGVKKAALDQAIRDVVKEYLADNNLTIRV